MACQIHIDQRDIDAVYHRGGEDVFDLWWTALGVVVRLKVLAQRKAGAAPSPPAALALERGRRCPVCS